jgi:nicotinamide-nucleotide amidase
VRQSEPTPDVFAERNHAVTAMRVEIINTGTELLLGTTPNTHLPFIAQRLLRLGLRVARQTTVGDNRAEMTAAVKNALARADILLITGGLGPTADDFTREIIAEILQRKLVHDENLAQLIADRFKKRNIPMPETVLKQAKIPEGARILPNPNGTAVGLVLEHKGKLVALLPGPPRELAPMFDEFLLPILRAHCKNLRPFCRIFRTTGLPESLLEQKIQPLIQKFPQLEVGFCAKIGEVELRIVTENAKIADEAEKIVESLIGDFVFSRGDERLEEVIVRLLTEKKLTLAVAESCTGGHIANRITNISGASNVFLSGVVTYSNAEKVRLLGVSPQTIEKFGAVSEQVAREMAENLRKKSGATFALSTTGIAGPTGGTSEKPVGLVFIGLASPDGVEVRQHLFVYDRETFKFISAQTALDWLRRGLQR